jgi:DNA-binding protein H-NS
MNLATLDGLEDADLRAIIARADGLLKRHDEERKAKAINEARALLASVGLSLKDLQGKGRAKPAKETSYHVGHLYQHPSDKALTWNAKGKKPVWLTALEAEGKTAIQVPQ